MKTGQIRPGVWALVASSVVTGALLVAACGGGGGASGSAVAHVGTTAPAATATTAAPSGGTGNSAKASAAAVKFASCVRAHGVPAFPDSAVNISPNGAVEFHTSGSGVSMSSPQMKSAMTACQHLIPHSNAGASAPSNGSTNQLVKYAQCMRSNGVPNFPEPNSSGRITVTQGTGNNSVDPSSPQYQSAAKACKSLEPPGFSGF